MATIPLIKAGCDMDGSKQTHSHSHSVRGSVTLCVVCKMLFFSVVIAILQLVKLAVICLEKSDQD